MGHEALAGLPNLRDAGGYPTLSGGRVRRGQVYRSSALTGLSDEQIREVCGLGLRVVFDLRSPQERAAKPDVPIDGVTLRGMDVLAGTSGFRPELLGQLLTDPVAARRALEGRSASEISEQRFRDLVSLDAARQGLRDLYTTLAEPAGRPALIHCSTGRDRTGWAVAALLDFLEVPREVVIDDYLKSEELLEPLTRPAREAFVREGGDEELFRSLGGVRRENLEAAFDEVERTYGSIEAYFEEGLGVGAEVREKLRASLVEDPSG